MLETIAAKFAYYLASNDWGMYLLGIVGILAACFLALRPRSTAHYRNYFPCEYFTFNPQNSSDCCGLLFVMIMLGIFAAALFSLEQSFFNNHDMMSLATVNILYEGVEASFKIFGRSRPLSFWEYNILFTLTDNPLWFSAYSLLLKCLFVFLLYKLLSFVPAAKRLFICGSIVFIPTVFWMNNIIFYEDQMMIYILLSFLGLRYFAQKNKMSGAAVFTIFMNFAVYSKENTILFYVGFLLVMLLDDVWRERLTPRSFLHPFRTMKQLPVETLVLISLALFSIIYGIGSGILSVNGYYSHRIVRSWSRLWELYHAELIWATLSLYILARQVWKTVRQQRPPASLIEYAWLAGSLIMVFSVVFVLRLAPRLGEYMQDKSYYLIIPAVFLTVYIFTQLKSQTSFILLTAALLLYSAARNAYIYDRQEGHGYRGVADFLNDYFSEKHETRIFISEHTEVRAWPVYTWASAYKYYYPEMKLKLLTPVVSPDELEFFHLANKNKNHDHRFVPVNYQKVPQSGDFYVVKKTSGYLKDIAVIGGLNHRLVYQNKNFEIYQII